MEKLQWKVQGMSCTNCALSIDQYLQGKGLQDVKVNFMGGEVSFNLPEDTSPQEIARGIEKLGYQVMGGTRLETNEKKHFFQNHFQRFLFCAVFTAPLVMHMIPGLHLHFLMNPYLQLALTLPVFIVGMDFFGRSAVNSLLKGVPNMNVLITLGAVSSFGYSLYGTISGRAADFMFYETTATILTLVFFGNWLEDKSVQTTQAALRKLAKGQKQLANMIAYDDQHQEHVFPVESSSLKVGDIILIRSGEVVPGDCKILWGDSNVSEAIITGESVPIIKKMNDRLIGGSTLVDGTVKAYVTAAGDDTVLSHILQMVRDAQTEKPPIQQLADRISAVFVPAVITIALITFLLNYFGAGHTVTESLLRSIAVLVIACPCAMGLATPAAIAVGLGRAARNGVLFRNARSLEVFRNIRQVVFDKTGTLTTGLFTIARYKVIGAESEETFKRIAYSLEKYSAHPIAKAITGEWKVKDDIRWRNIEEIKGLGMKATDKAGDEYVAGSYAIAADLTTDAAHNIYVTKNEALIGWIDLMDQARPEAARVIAAMKTQGIKTILLSGDRLEKCMQVADQLGIDEVIAGQTPEQKLEKIATLDRIGPVAMVGDGINDAPALAKATVGISLSDASHLAIQSAQVVLMNHGLNNLPLALGLGRHTYLTIRQNLFWAFAYNIVAIPVAAFGLLSPAFSALVMGFSDVVLAINSVRLNYKRVGDTNI